MAMRISTHLNIKKNEAHKSLAFKISLKLLEMKHIAFFIHLQQLGTEFDYDIFIEIVTRWNMHTDSSTEVKSRFVRALISIHMSARMKFWDNFILTTTEQFELLHSY